MWIVLGLTTGKKVSYKPSGFIPNNRVVVGMILVAINPLSGDNIGTGRFWHKIPCRVLEESRKFCTHGLTSDQFGSAKADR
jgi:hypothetical protein